MKTLYLHIGLPKTGSTAIQRFCFYNKEILAANGYCYDMVMKSTTRVPSYVNGLFITEKIYDKNGNIDSEATREHFENGLSVVQKQLNEFDNVIISAEPIWNSIRQKEGWLQLKEFHKLCKDNNATIKVIVYLRSQDEYLSSLWKQRIKNGYRIKDWNSTKLQQPSSMKLDFKSRIDKLENFFGKENIILRIYDRNNFCGSDKSIYSDFLDAIGLEKTPDYEVPDYLINTSVDIEFAEIKRILNNLQDTFQKNSPISEFFEQIAVQCTQKRINNGLPASSMFTNEERKHFLDRFAEGNEHIQKSYFPEKETLFRETKDDNMCWDKQNEKMLDSIIFYFGEIVWQQQTEIDGLKAELKQLKKEVHSPSRLDKIKKLFHK